MTAPMRVVVDTGVFVSAFIRRQGTVGAVLQHLRDGRFTLIYTEPLLIELVNVLGRPKIRQKYRVTGADVAALLNLIRLRGTPIVPTRKITACRDPKDDKFLEAALAGNADCIVTGDRDLLVLHPFESLPILTPADFLAQLA